MARGIAVWPERLETGILETGGDGTAFTVAEEYLDKLQLEVGWVELLELLCRVGRGRLKGGHCCFTRWPWRGGWRCLYHVCGGAWKLASEVNGRN